MTLCLTVVLWDFLVSVRPYFSCSDPSVNNNMISWFTSVFFSLLEGIRLEYVWGLFEVGPGFHISSRSSVLISSSAHPGSLKIVQGHDGLCPQWLCGWNCRNCMVKCRGLNVTGARSAHYSRAGYLAEACGHILIMNQGRRTTKISRALSLSQSSFTQNRGRMIADLIRHDFFYLFFCS